MATFVDAPKITMAATTTAGFVAAPATTCPFHHEGTTPAPFLGMKDMTMMEEEEHQEEPSLSSSLILLPSRASILPGHQQQPQGGDVVPLLPKYASNESGQCISGGGDAGRTMANLWWTTTAVFALLCFLLLWCWDQTQKRRQQVAALQQQNQSLLQLVEQRRQAEVQALQQDAERHAALQHELVNQQVTHDAQLHALRQGHQTAMATAEQETKEAIQVLNEHRLHELAQWQTKYDFEKWTNERNLQAYDEQGAALRQQQDDNQELEAQLDEATRQTARLTTQVHQLEERQCDVVRCQYDMNFTLAEYQKRTTMTETATGCRLPETRLRGNGGRGSTATWYWAEDPGRMSQHRSKRQQSQPILKGTTFVQYANDIASYLEISYCRYQAGTGSYCVHVRQQTAVTADAPQHSKHNSSTTTSCLYRIDLAAMTQENQQTGRVREIRRVPSKKVNVSWTLPVVPDDISAGNEERLLQTHAGQLIQVIRVHDNGLWYYGKVLHDPLWSKDGEEYELQTYNSLNDNKKNKKKQSSTSSNKTSAQSGWIPVCLTEPVKAHVIQQLLETMSAHASVSPLQVPHSWEPGLSGRVRVPKGTPEYKRIKNYFVSTLMENHKFSIHSIERIQNLRLWQEYSVQKVEMQNRDHVTHQACRSNNMGKLERQWLFHGSSEDACNEIVQRGFDRAFSGNVAWGKGCYFSESGDYSSHIRYAAPNAQGVQSVFLCRVLVGDWCLGRPDMLVPDKKGRNSQHYYDSSVDQVDNPMTFVTYHDSQAYPEYLVSFTTQRGR